MAYVEWTDDMGEISGFGGGYEQACRDMVRAGVEFWEQQPDTFDPHYRGYEGVFGVLADDNDDAKALDEVVIAASKGEATGAMHQAAINHILAFRKLGADEYVQQLRSREKHE